MIMQEPQDEIEKLNSESHTPKKSVTRRLALGSLFSALIASIASFFVKPARALSGYWLRPPGAVPEAEFLSKCVRCFKCANVCPNDCIKFHGFGAGLKRVFTPYIKARTRGCTLCGECGKVCPTGALKPFANNEESWTANVNMGVARVNKSMCFSYHGRTCGACYQACPIAGRAMKIGVFETPIVVPEVCVGCGLCEQACLHLPQAIRVIPTRGEV
jgi:ferredoxin-type protein NapG